MAILFDAAGAFWANVTTGLPASTGDVTLCAMIRQTSSVSNQGNVFGFAATHTGPTLRTPSYFHNGSSLFASISGASNISNVGQYTLNQWELLTIRIDSVAGLYRFNRFDGTVWGTERTAAAPALQSIDDIYLGYTGSYTHGRSTSVAGLEFAFVRFWGGAALSDAELEAEFASATPVKAGCTKHWTGNNTYADALGGDALTPSATTPVLNTNLPATGPAAPEITGDITHAHAVAAGAMTYTAATVTVAGTQANGRELRDENQALITSGTVSWEWYDKTTDTTGNPLDSGTFTPDANGEWSITPTGSTLLTGQSGTLILELGTKRGIYELTVVRS